MKSLAAILCLTLLLSGCLCRPQTDGGNPPKTTVTVIQEPTTSTAAQGQDRVCQEIVNECNQKTSPSERAYCKKSLGC
jgi:hypothetical protein